jgi:prefoldin alpha subunit
MASPAAAQQQRSAKIAEYERFIGERLRPDLLAAEQARDKTQREVLQWEALVVNARSLREEGREEMRTLVDLGAQVYCQADVPDTSRVFVSVGLGFHAEMTLEEAEAFAERKMEKLRQDVAKKIEEVADVQSHVKLVAEGIRELAQLTDDGSGVRSKGGFDRPTM